MWPISIPRALRSTPLPLGLGSAVEDLGGLDRAVGGEVAAMDQVDHVHAGPVGTGDPVAALGNPWVE